MITFEQVLSFRAVYERGSYSSAGRALDKDRTTVREHVLALEDILGNELFVITGKKAIATEFADTLFPRALSLVKQALDFEQAALSSFHHQLSEININFDVIMPNQLLVEIDLAVSKVMPFIKLNWLHRNRKETLEQLVKGKVHLALMPNKPRTLANNEILYTHLGTVPLSIYARPSSPLAKKPIVNLSDLQLEKQFIHENLLTAGMEWVRVSTHYHIVSDNDLLLAMIKQQGWAFMSDISAEQSVINNQLVKIKPKELLNSFQQGVTLFYPFLYEHNKTMQSIIDIVKKIAARHLG